MITFAGEQRFGFQVGNVNVRSAEFPVKLFQEIFSLLRIRFFLRQMNIGLKVAAQRGELFVGGNLLFGALTFAQNALCSFLIAPEIGVGDAGFERLQTFAVGFGVKDNSGPA
jgi:hypothetical protein